MMCFFAAKKFAGMLKYKMDIQKGGHGNVGNQIGKLNGLIGTHYYTI